MAVEMLKAAVGVPGKDGNCKLVKNTPKDVAVVRRMLLANGHKVHEEGRFDAKMGAVIKGVQKKCGIKECDGVLVPGDKATKSLLTKYIAQEKFASTIKVKVFKVSGKTYELVPKDFDLAVAKIFKKVDPSTRKMIQQVDYTMDRYKFYLDTAMVKDGIAMAMVQASIMTIGRVKFPDDKLMIKALDARNALDRSLRSQDLTLFCKAMRTAEQDINAFVAAFRTYVQKMESNGKAIQGKVDVVRTVAFASVEILAVPVVMTYTRLPPDKAYLASKTAVAGIESLATDLGKQIAGQKVTAAGSLGRASYAMAKEMVLGWLGGKIKFKGKLLTRIMNKLGPALTKSFPFIPKGMAANFAARYIQGFGEDALKGVMEGLVKAVEIALKKGSSPSAAEFEKLVDDVVMKATLGGLGKNLGKFNKSWSAKNSQILTYKFAPVAFKKIDSTNVLNDADRAFIVKKFLGLSEGMALKKGYEAVFSTATGHESAAALEAMAIKALKADTTISKQIEDLISKELANKKKK